MILHPYDPSWPEEFRRLETAYQRALGPVLLRVEHVGSTAIPGIAAKPILDIDLVLATDADFPAVKAGLERLGYRHNGDQGIPGREAFKRLDAEAPHGEGGGHWMAHHLYVCVEGCRELLRHTAFRDYLEAHPEAAAEYESLKKRLEARSGGERQRYVDLKENEGECRAFVERILEKARPADREGPVLRSPTAAVSPTQGKQP